MRNILSLALVALLLNLAAGVLGQKCTCTRKIVYMRRYTVTQTITGSASCTSVGIRPTCIAVTTTRSTSTIRTTSASQPPLTTRTNTAATRTSTTARTSTAPSTLTISTRTSTTSTRASTTSTTSGTCSPSPVRSSGKRGLAYNDATLTNLFSNTCSTPSSRVTWAYNWFSSPYAAGTPQSGLHPNLRFVPMLWSAHPDLTSVWQRNVASAVSSAGADAVLAFNEPDGCGGGGACMSLDDTVSGYRTWVSPLRNTYPSLSLGAPAVTNGGGDAMGLGFLRRFLAACSGCNIDFVPVHWYGAAGGAEDFKAHVRSAYAAAGNRPIWVTEFGCTSGTEAQVQAFLRGVLPWLDQQAFVARYAYFWDAPGYLVDGATGKQSAQGKIYDTL